MTLTISLYLPAKPSNLSFSSSSSSSSSSSLVFSFLLPDLLFFPSFFPLFFSFYFPSRSFLLLVFSPLLAASTVEKSPSLRSDLRFQPVFPLAVRNYSHLFLSLSLSPSPYRRSSPLTVVPSLQFSPRRSSASRSIYPSIYLSIYLSISVTVSSSSAPRFIIFLQVSTLSVCYAPLRSLHRVAPAKNYRFGSVRFEFSLVLSIFPFNRWTTTHRRREGRRSAGWIVEPGRDPFHAACFPLPTEAFHREQNGRVPSESVVPATYRSYIVCVAAR